MPRRQMLRVQSGDHTFLSARDASGEPHITYRPAISTKVAIDTFLAGPHTWNQDRPRYEAYTDDHGIYWTWLYGDDTSTNVLILSCFDR